MQNRLVAVFRRKSTTALERLKDDVRKVDQLIKFGRATILVVPLLMGCHFTQRGGAMLDQQQVEKAVGELRAAYAAFNRGDIDAAVQLLDRQVVWTEPVEFPGGGTYHGIEGAKRYLSQSRSSADQVVSQPEQFIPSGNRIVVFVHARVLPKGSDIWQDVKLADVYTFQGGKVTEMRAFADRQKALRWAGIEQPQN